MKKETKRILVTGASGQIGSELTLALRKIYGNDNVIASDIAEPQQGSPLANGIFEKLDVTNFDAFEQVVKKHNIDTIVHLAAILSAVGESNPTRCWNVN
ncbi:MAG: NAD-dependent epimerase/dehydratase family protein, partial [Candidatus Kapaibacteriota bacterium]